MKTVVHGLDLFNNACATMAKLLVCICVAVQIVIVFCGVVWRYFLHSPLTWVDELATLLLVMVAFWGCYLALSQCKLARIELLLDSFKGKMRVAVYVLSEICSLVMLAIVVYYGVKLFMMPTSLNQKTSGMYIPLWIFYGMIPLTFGLNIISTITKILHYIFDEGEEKAIC